MHIHEYLHSLFLNLFLLSSYNLEQQSFEHTFTETQNYIVLLTMYDIV